MSNVDKVRTKTVPVVIDGKPHSLRYDLNAFADIESQYDDIDKALVALGKGSPTAMRVVLWAGLRHENEKLTIREVGVMFGMPEIDAISNEMTEAIESSLPELTDDQKRIIKDRKAAAQKKMDEGKVEEAKKSSGASNPQSSPLKTPGTGDGSSTRVQ